MIPVQTQHLSTLKLLSHISVSRPQTGNDSCANTTPLNSKTAISYLGLPPRDGLWFLSQWGNRWVRRQVSLKKFAEERWEMGWIGQAASIVKLRAPFSLTAPIDHPSVIPVQTQHVSTLKLPSHISVYRPQTGYDSCANTTPLNSKTAISHLGLPPRNGLRFLSQWGNRWVRRQVSLKKIAEERREMGWIGQAASIV